MNLNLDTIDKTARFLVRMEYPKDEVMEVLMRDFPGEDAHAAYEAAVEQKDISDRQLASELDRDAVEQEHKP